MTRSSLSPTTGTDPLSAGLLGLGTDLGQMLRPRPAAAGQRLIWLRGLLARLRRRNRLAAADARALRDVGVSAAQARPPSRWPVAADAATTLSLRASGWR